MVSIALGVVRVVGDTPSDHRLLTADGLTRDALDESARRLTAAAGLASGFSPGAEGAGQ